MRQLTEVKHGKKAADRAKCLSSQGKSTQPTQPAAVQHPQGHCGSPDQGWGRSDQPSPQAPHASSGQPHAPLTLRGPPAEGLETHQACTQRNRDHSSADHG